jgi:hypothetical protein
MSRKKDLPFGFEEGEQYVGRAEAPPAGQVSLVPGQAGAEGHFRLERLQRRQKHTIENKVGAEEQMAVCLSLQGSHGRLIEGIGPVVSRHLEGLPATRQMLPTLASLSRTQVPRMGAVPQRSDVL